VTAVSSEQPESSPEVPPRQRVVRWWGRRILVACACLVAALGLVAAGEHAPRWMLGLGVRAGLDPFDTVRFAAGIFLALAAIVLVVLGLGRLGLFLACAVLFFTGLATASAFSVHALPVTAVGLVCALVGAVVAWSLANAGGDVATSARASRVTGAWRVLAVVLLSTASLAATARLPVERIDAFLGTEPPLISESTNPYLEGTLTTFEFDRWEGRRIEETGLLAFLPSLADKVGQGTVYIVLYNKTCGACHEFFRTWFSGPLTVPVYAVEIPSAPGAVVAPGDEIEDIDCPQCERLSLPTGRMWAVTPPSVIRIEDGFVHCAREGGSDECISVR
jgi:hypothetical protein